MLIVIIHPPSHFLERLEEDKTLVVGGKDSELYLESCELVGSQIMR